MNKTDYPIKTLFLVPLFLIGAGQVTPSQANHSLSVSPPNIVILFADDLGYAGFSI